VGAVLGWGKDSLNLTTGGWIQRVLGWLLTMIAVSLGAPFWFDMLNKIINIRNAGTKPATSDSQPTPGTAPLVVNVQTGADAKTT